ncbi:MAG: Multidrug resistance protein MdtF [Paracidovorax wautersii]|uniref:Multidrug resistance protein MdtF n=1 Tax=Paracidovorax wautersii TaxID=1177982 RepID=A0A7V8FMW3_9BURK|nr:MAG: Multidrug resistance protein MdtF [Paracidovorax wautersii]
MALRALHLTIAVVGIAAASALAYWWQHERLPAKGVAPAASAGSPGAGRVSQAVPVEAGRVSVMRMMDEAQAVGTLRSRQTVTVRPEVNGRITQLNFRDGAPVKRGQVLVQFDNQLELAQLRQAEAQLAIARTNHQRNQDLAARSFISASAVDQSAASLQVAQAQHALAQATVARLRILAPFDGITGIANVSVGDYLSAGQSIVNLEDMAVMFVDYRLPERYQTRLQPGQIARVGFDALPGETFEARVLAVDPRIDAEGRSLYVRGCIDNARARLRPGMFARVSAVFDVRDDVIVVPEEAVALQGDKAHVFRIVTLADGRAVAERLEVRLGARRQGRVEIVNGSLQAGEAIVLAGQQRLGAGNTPVSVSNSGALSPLDGSAAAALAPALQPARAVVVADRAPTVRRLGRRLGRRPARLSSAPPPRWPCRRRAAPASDGGGPAMKLAEISIRRPVFATVLSLLVLLIGIVSYFSLPVREYPRIDEPIVTVSVTYTGASAEVMETQVSKVLKDSIAGIDGVDILTSISRAERSQITARFRLDKNPDSAAADVRDRTSRVRGRLPDDIDDPIISKVEADAWPIIWLTFSSDRMSRLVLSDVVNRIAKPRLQTATGVAEVNLYGERQYAMRIWLDAERLAAFQLTTADVEAAIRANNLELPAGRIESSQREFGVTAQTNLVTPEQFANIVIRTVNGFPVRMRDVARVEEGALDERSTARINGRDAVMVGITRQATANPLDLSRAVRAMLPQVEQDLGGGVSIQVANDSSIFIERSIHNVYRTIAEAVVLVTLVIFVFLRTLRASIIPIVTIPVSLVGTFALMSLAGFSINTLTLLALVLAIGLVVDDAIVVLENIYRHIEEGMAPFQAALRGSREVGFAIVAMTLTLAAARGRGLAAHAAVAAALAGGGGHAGGGHCHRAGLPTPAPGTGAGGRPGRDQRAHHRARRRHAGLHQPLHRPGREAG